MEPNQLTIGDLLKKLDELDEFDYITLVEHLHSYDLDNTGLALEFTDGSMFICILKKELKECIGLAFETKLGTEHVMTVDSLVWAAVEGDNDGEKIIGITKEYDMYRFLTT